MNKNKKECVASIIEFICCGFIFMIFMVCASVCLVFGEWLITILSYILCVVSGYYAIKGVLRYFDLTAKTDWKDED